VAAVPSGPNWTTLPTIPIKKLTRVGAQMAVNAAFPSSIGLHSVLFRFRAIWDVVDFRIQRIITLK
jgi:hypothetical protein